MQRRMIRVNVWTKNMAKCRITMQNVAPILEHRLNNNIYSQQCTAREVSIVYSDSEIRKLGDPPLCKNLTSHLILLNEMHSTTL